MGDAHVICTIGHARRTLEELASVLRAHRVVHLVDVRTVPRSRTNPRFNADVIGDWLAPYGIAYGRIAELLRLSDDAAMRDDGRVAVMCAEMVWWRCHRRIIADHLLARGVPVLHLFDEKKAEPAKLSEHARVDDDRVSYPSLIATRVR